MFVPKQCSEFEELSTGTAEEVLYSFCFRSEGSGAKQCSDVECKISKSELCADEAEVVLHLRCFRSEGSCAKQCSGFEGKISKSELCTGTPKKYCIYCVSEVKAQVQISAVVPKKR